jgi:hypothetical protein
LHPETTEPHGRGRVFNNACELKLALQQTNQSLLLLRETFKKSLAFWKRMGESDLPKDLEARIVTVSAGSYLNHYGLDPDQYDLVGFRTTMNIQASSFAYNSERYYSELYRTATQEMEKKKILAITDVRLNEILAGFVGYNSRAITLILYGTAIIPKPSAQNPAPTEPISDHQSPK